MEKPSSVKIVLMGQILVNIPVTIVIFIIAAALFYFVEAGIFISVIIATAVGWFLWDKLLDVWINWSLKRGVDREHLFKLGKIGFINFYRDRIILKDSDIAATKTDSL